MPQTSRKTWGMTNGYYKVNYRTAISGIRFHMWLIGQFRCLRLSLRDSCGSRRRSLPASNPICNPSHSRFEPSCLCTHTHTRTHTLSLSLSLFLWYEDPVPPTGCNTEGRCFLCGSCEDDESRRISGQRVQLEE
jgi:hypothetical protein